MKTNRMFLLLSVAATLLCTACSSDDDPLVSAAADDATTTATEWKTIHYEATVSDGSSTRATLDDENKYIFESGDKLIVAGENIKGELALKSGDEGKHTGATFEGDLEYTGSAPTAETSLTATLVSSADAIHTVSGKAITATYNYDRDVEVWREMSVDVNQQPFDDGTYSRSRRRLRSSTSPSPWTTVLLMALP